MTQREPSAAAVEEAAPSSAAGPKAFYKRDALIEIEREMQAAWSVEKPYDADPVSGEKYFVTFTYPYMNGRLHLGHSFSLSKADFAARYQRLRGKQVLFPFGYHCTGMPIKASADKLRKELETFGCPPRFPEDDAETAKSAANAKHSKVAVKTGGAKYQWHIMRSIGVAEEEIPKFIDVNYWMTYFPPKCEDDIRKFGLHADFRRSFVTTDVNPFYDSFIRWQFHKLRAQNRIRFGKRHTIYSPLDAQPCMDHDRQSGEGVEPKEYINIKLELIQSPAFSAKFPELKERKVFLIAGTLRPETMYGQTNCWVGPEIEYGAFDGRNGEVYICTKRAALNMAYQGLSIEDSKVSRACAEPIRGVDLINEKVKAPLSVYEHVYVLPMMSISANKGTGIVTSVPSNSPDDFTALRDLREKEALREKYGIPAEHVLPFTAISIIDSPTLGAFAAETICAQMNIRSQNDRVALEKAKEACYKEDFYQGIMKVGSEAGKSVSEAKPVIREQLINDNLAFVYYEPENLVMSRSGDECVVALTDQWFIAYGEPSWRAEVARCLEKLNCFSSETRHQFEATLDWMQQWACSRSFGLGSRLPWDPQFLIESLSDSTLYPAYYTVAHILHEGSLDGSVRPNGINPEQMSDEVWDYVFGLSEDLSGVCKQSGISEALLSRMRTEFECFFPCDLRISGKDLIPNHLTFYLYNHVAIFPEKYWPRGVRANGHLMLNSQKMSKSTGNFMTLFEACDEFSADATRIGLADAGDALEDANFLKETANAAILRLTSLVEFCREVYGREEGVTAEWREGSELVWADEVLNAEIDKAIRECETAYEATHYREVIKHAFFELGNARDRYRDVTSLHGSLGMHRPTLQRFCEVQLRLLAPIIPHVTDYLWRNVVNPDHSSIMGAKWPEMQKSDVDEALLASGAYLTRVAHDLRTTLAADSVPGKKGAAVAAVPNAAEIFVAVGYPKWQEDALRILNERWDTQAGSFGADDQLVAALKPLTSGRPNKKLIPFVMEVKKKVLAASQDSTAAPEARLKTIKKLLSPIPDADALLGRSESALLHENMDYLCRTLSLAAISVKPVWGQGFGESEVEAIEDAQVKRKIEAANPGAPTVRFFQRD